jgi:hypothetical protein
MRKIEITEGDRFGKLVVMYEEDHKVLPCGQTNRVIRCVCDCGKQTSVRLLHLIRGRIRSCGCLGGEIHGGTGTVLYRRWRGMINRCYMPSFPNSYTANNITVCDEWRHSYSKFREWAMNNGYKRGLTIDRIDNNKGYYPANCRFVTVFENANNKSDTIYVNYHGETMPYMVLIRKKKLLRHEATIRCRIKRGWNINDAIDKPIRQGNYKRKVFTEEQAEAAQKKKHKYKPNYYLKKIAEKEALNNENAY